MKHSENVLIFLMQKKDALVDSPVNTLYWEASRGKKDGKAEDKEKTRLWWGELWGVGGWETGLPWGYVWGGEAEE